MRCSALRALERQYVPIISGGVRGRTVDLQYMYENSSLVVIILCQCSFKATVILHELETERSCLDTY